MATHNQARILGYLTSDPVIMNEGQEGAEKITFQIRTTRRAVDGYIGPNFEDLFVFYDGIELMPRMKKLKKLDLIDIKGVLNILTLNKRSRHKECNTVNIKYNSSSAFIYPISLIKLNGLQTTYEDNEDLPDMLLSKYYREISNQVIIIGTVVTDPEMIGTEKHPCCRYGLGVNRKYYIATQSHLTADYPWVYTYGQQAEWDYKYLKRDAVVLVDGFMHNLPIKSKVHCDACNVDYTFPDFATSFIPYSLEYLSGYLTDEEIAVQEELRRKMMIHDALQ